MEELHTLRVPPVGTFHVRPPVADVHPIDGTSRPHEHERACIQHLRQRSRILRRIGWNLRERRVPRRFDKPREALVGRWILVDPETVHRFPMDGTFLGIVILRTHLVVGRRDPDHVRKWRLFESFLSDYGTLISRRHLAPLFIRQTLTVPGHRCSMNTIFQLT